jgi:hypothetical protein
MGQVDDAIAYATAQIGKPYVFGAAGPNSFDCSGLVVAAFKHANPPLNLPHFTGALIFEGSEVAKSALVPGDLVFPDSGHVQIYLGNNQIVEAPHTGANVRTGPMWGFWRARRVAGSGEGLSPIDSVGSDGNAVTALLTPVEILAKALGPFSLVGTNITSPIFWRRVGMFFTGMALIVFGIIFIMRRPIANTGRVIVGSAADLGKTVVGGAAFGAGASFGGGGGGAPTIAQSVQRAVPRPPAAANRAQLTGTPPSAPVTAPMAPRSPYQVSPASVFVGRARRPTAALPGGVAQGAGGAGNLAGMKPKGKKGGAHRA